MRAPAACDLGKHGVGDVTVRTVAAVGGEEPLFHEGENVEALAGDVTHVEMRHVAAAHFAPSAAHV